jgi:hypothetical protein
MMTKEKFRFIVFSVGCGIAALIMGFSFNAEMNLKERIAPALKAGVNGKIGQINDLLLAGQKGLLVLQDSEAIKKALPLLDQWSGSPGNYSYVEARNTVEAQIEAVQKAYGFVNIMLVNAQGKVVFVYKPERIFHLNDPSPFRGAYSSMVAVGGNLGGVRPSSLVDERMVVDRVGLVYGSEKELLGFVHVEIPAASLCAILKGSGASQKTEETFLVSVAPGDKAIFLSALDEGLEALLKTSVDLGAKADVPVVKAALGEAGSGDGRDHRGNSVFSVWQPIPALEAGIVTSVNAGETFKSIVDLRNFALIGFGVAFLMIMCV